MYNNKEGLDPVMEWVIEAAHKHKNKHLLDKVQEENGVLLYKDNVIGYGATFTNEKPPKDMRLGDQWHQIIE